MPTYEMIILCKLGETQALGNLIKSLVVAVYREGGIVRRFVNLGDRISDKSYKSKDGNRHAMIRYFTCEFDANPESKTVAEQVANSSSESLHVFTHRLKDRDYYKHITNNESWKEYEVEKDFKQYKEEAMKLNAQRNVDAETVENEQNNSSDKSGNDQDLSDYLDKMKNKLI